MLRVSIASSTPEPAQPGDLSAIKALLERCGLPQQDLNTAHLADFLVLREVDAPIGIVGLERYGGDGLLRSLAVKERYRGQGAGEALVAALESRARQIGVETLYLLTMTAGDFFASQGYEVISRDTAPAGVQRSAEFTSLCPVNAVCMRKPLVRIPRTSL